MAWAFLEACELLSLLPVRGDALSSALDELEHLRHGEKGLFPDVSDAYWKSLSSGFDELGNDREES